MMIPIINLLDKSKKSLSLIDRWESSVVEDSSAD